MQPAIKAIAEPRRREILRLVWSRELPAGEIARHFNITRSAISQHIRVLKTSGLLAERRDGTRRLYRARPETIESLREFLEEFWDTSLRRLKIEAEAEERRKPRKIMRRGRANR